MEIVTNAFIWLFFAACIGGMLFLLVAIIRYSVISPFLTRGASTRLRKPNVEGIEALVGFSVSDSLIEFYRRWPHLEKTEYYLVDSRTEANWFISGFSPLSRIDAHEWIKVSGKHGLPIADDMNKGIYFVNSGGAIELWSPNVPGGYVRVADSIEQLSEFRVAECEEIHRDEQA